jgi:hypothetical protein
MSFKLDLHVHAAERSACATSYEEDQIRSAIAAGMQGMAFTDHHALVPERRLAELNDQYFPFHIYSGIEVTAEDEDWLVYGFRDPQMERTDWRYADLARAVRKGGGFIALAHPFRYSRSIQVSLEAYPPHGIEVRSYNTPAGREKDIRYLATRLGMTLLTNSDAHSTSRVGKFWNELPVLPANDAELVKALIDQRI